jgi:hypothetical protein
VTDRVLDSRTLGKKVAPKASRTGIDDDIDKTIAAFLSKRLQADWRSFSDLTIASGLAVPAHDLPPKKKRMLNKLKSGAGKDGADHATALVPPTRSEVFMEANNAASSQSPESEANSTPSVSSSGSSSTESPQMSIPVHTLTAVSSGGLSPEARHAIAKDPEISEVHIESHGEGGSSDESSAEGEGDEEAVPLVKRARSVIAPSVPVHLLEDQLTALIRGPEKREPYKSVLDEIPSRSETGSETSSEDLILDEEEDLSRQPSQKQMRVLSTVPLLSIEPESTSEDEERASLPIYMDTSHEVPHRPSVSFFHLQEVSDGD